MKDSKPNGPPVGPPAMDPFLADLLGLHADSIEHKPIQPAFAYMGCKFEFAHRVLPLLPHRKVFVEVFGGSGSMLLSKAPCEIDVYNELDSRLVNFYQVVQDRGNLRAFSDLANNCVHSREFFMHCKNLRDGRIESSKLMQAFAYFYVARHSFGSQGRNFGRAARYISGSSRHELLLKANKRLPAIQQRFAKVRIHNRDWSEILTEYASKETVFYMDPPYLDTCLSAYRHKMDPEAHRRMLEAVHRLPGLFVLSGFANGIYDSYDWDDRHQFVRKDSATTNIQRDNNRREGTLIGKKDVIEVLWIKDNT